MDCLIFESFALKQKETNKGETTDIKWKDDCFIQKLIHYFAAQHWQHWEPTYCTGKLDRLTQPPSKTTLTFSQSSADCIARMEGFWVYLQYTWKTQNPSMREIQSAYDQPKAAVVLRGGCACSSHVLMSMGETNLYYFPFSAAILTQPLHLHNTIWGHFNKPFWL